MSPAPDEPSRGDRRPGGLAARVLALLRRRGSVRDSADAALFRDAVDCLDDAIALVEPCGRVARINQAYVRMFPRVAARVGPATTYAETVRFAAEVEREADPAFDVARHVAAHLGIHRSGRRIERRTRDGRVIMIQDRPTASGGALVIHRDITAERDAVEIVAASEARFRDFAESTADWFWELDADLRFTFVADSYERVLGWPTSTMIGRHVRDLRHDGANEPYWLDALARLDRHEAVADVRFYIPDSQGRRRHLTVTAKPINDATGRFAGYRGSGRDISEEVRARAEISRLALVAQRTDNSVMICDGAERIVWVNEAFARMTGCGRDDAVGRRPAELLDEPDVDPEAATRTAAALARGEVVTAETCHTTRDGRGIWVQKECTPILGADGRLEQHITICIDVTARKEQEARLAEALRRERELVAQQRRFASVAAHEFRTPLTIIDGAAQRLARNAARLTPAEVHERSDKIRAAVARMSQLIDTTLAAARFDEGRIEAQCAPLDVVDLVTTVCRRLGAVAADFHLEIECPEPAVEAELDARLMDQVFTNLISNAIKYSGTSRRIVIGIEPTPTSVRIAVRDDGIGIPATEIGELFTRFFRASNARGLPGTGIGLNLVKELVALHEGSVAVESEVGRGTTFAVTLPRRAGTRAAVAAE